MSGILEKWPKQPGETEDYDVSFVEYLAARSDTGISHTVVADDGITVEESALADGVVKVWLSGGTSGVTYKVTVTLTTSGGRIKQAEFQVKVKEI